MDNKLTYFRQSREYLALTDENRAFLEELCTNWYFSRQEIRQILLLSRDLETWDEGCLSDLWGPKTPEKPGNRNEKDQRYKKLISRWHALKDKPKSYKGFHPGRITNPKPGFKIIEDDRTILGDCPVASEKTRCCNLKTLDAVSGCGFDCSYCSIQSFYNNDKVLYHKNLSDKLSQLKLDTEKTWHIGTGQSSDSLMWGNKDGLLENLCGFASRNPNVILELKTKSDNIEDLLKLDVPPNILVSWSLNTQTLIDAEERLTASLDKRLKAARKAADKGIAIGFHLHPMVWYEDFKSEYRQMTEKMTSLFQPEEVVMVSLGTLTFINSVLKKLRERPIKSKILQMPLEEAAGKWSYPHSIKKELFHTAYEGLKDWHKEVYFYLCMEDPSLWKGLFYREYKDNEEFERDMLYTYNQKIQSIYRRRMK